MARTLLKLKLSLPLLLLLLLWCVYVADGKVVCPSGGFFCLNEEAYVQCDDDNLGTSVLWTCASGNVCKCGKSTSEYGPCAWAFEDVNGSCVGAAGSVVSDWSGLRRTLDAVYARAPSKHVPLVLHFHRDKWQSELAEVMRAGFFDDESLFIPCDGRHYRCSLHPPVSYDTNPSQLWIGKPRNPATVLGEDYFVRLPDKLTALWLGYALDQYGINPGLLLAMMAVRSGTGLQEKANGDYFSFIVGNGDDEWTCFATGYGSCKSALASRGGNIDGGPYQTTATNMAFDLSIEATRVAANSTQPLFVSHLYHTARATNLAAIHAEWGRSIGRATIRTALELHWIHTVVFTLDQVGMRGSNWEQRTRYGRDALEFAVTSHVLRHGLFSGRLGANLVGCNSTLDPVTKCKLDDASGSIAQIQAVCRTLDESKTVYDFPVSWALVNKFLSVLQWSHPISAVTSVHDAIDWAGIRANASTAFATLAAHRKLADPSYNGTISVRYDWRALLAVIRAGLPGSELLVGPTMQGIDHAFYGVINDALYVDISDWPLSSCYVAGGTTDLCATCVL